MSSVYIHVPFCKQRCAYCDFCSQTYLKKEKRYFLAIQKHIKSVADETFRVDSIFFGGGTPSVVDAKHIVETIETIRQSFTVVPDVEITVECNPESVTKEKILAYKESGVNRISIGLQTIHDETLKKINRIHTYAEAIEAVKIVNGCGIENINVDLLLGLPDETEDMFFKSVRFRLKHTPRRCSGLPRGKMEVVPDFSVSPAQRPIVFTMRAYAHMSSHPRPKERT